MRLPTFYEQNLIPNWGNSIRLFKDRKSFYVYVYSSVWTRTKIEVFSENPDLFYFTNVTDEISISDLEEISIS